MNTRDLLNHGNGKGDKPRTRLNNEWRKNYKKIFWGKVIETKGFTRHHAKLIKKYS